jgi:hypothetical protein
MSYICVCPSHCSAVSLLVRPCPCLSVRSSIRPPVRPSARPSTSPFMAIVLLRATALYTCTIYAIDGVRAHSRHLIFCLGKLVAIRVYGVRVPGPNAWSGTKPSQSHNLRTLSILNLLAHRVIIGDFHTSNTCTSVRAVSETVSTQQYTAILEAAARELCTMV